MEGTNAEFKDIKESQKDIKLGHISLTFIYL